MAVAFVKRGFVKCWSVEPSCAVVAVAVVTVAAAADLRTIDCQTAQFAGPRMAKLDLAVAGLKMAQLGLAAAEPSRSHLARAVVAAPECYPVAPVPPVMFRSASSQHLAPLTFALAAEPCYMQDSVMAELLAVGWQQVGQHSSYCLGILGDQAAELGVLGLVGCSIAW